MIRSSGTDGQTAIGTTLIGDAHMAKSKHMRKAEKRRGGNPVAIVALIAIVAVIAFVAYRALTPRASVPSTQQDATQDTTTPSTNQESQGRDKPTTSDATPSNAATGQPADTSAEDAASDRLAQDPSGTTATEAGWATLQYPSRWDEVCKIEEGADSVRYLATVHRGEEVLLFTVSTKPLDGGSKLGTLDGQDLYLKTEEAQPGSDWATYEADELRTMLEDVNVLIDSLYNAPGFVSAS